MPNELESLNQHAAVRSALPVRGRTRAGVGSIFLREAMQGAFNGIGEVLESAIRFVIVSYAILIPLAIWKMIDIAIWLFSHISVQF
jgi:hypothetical protein